MPVYQALKTGICQSPKGEKNISNQYVLYLSFCEDIPFYTNDRSIMYYHDVLNDICYEIGSELSYMGKASGITDKLSILNGFKQSRPDEYQQLIEEIKEAFVPTFFKKDVPDEMSFVFSESFVDWLKYNSVHDFAAVGQALQDADRTITISPKDILNDYIIPTLKGNLHTISTLAQSLGVYTFVDVQVEDGPLMNVLREELPKLNYYKYNSGWIQYELGYLTHYGQGCDRDIEAAIKYYTAAYKDGNVLACNLLGWIFQQGDGVTVDLIQAVEWYSRGSQMGNADAMNNLAYMYLNGLGVEVDENKAFEWYVKASEGGNLNSMIRLAEFYFKGGPTPVDYSKAYEWANKAISIGNAPRIANAKYIVGYILYNGLAGERDYENAIRNLVQASDAGVKEAHSVCGDVIEASGRKIPLLDRSAGAINDGFIFYYRAHKNGDTDATIKMVGIMQEKWSDRLWLKTNLPEDCRCGVLAILRPLADSGNTQAQYLFAKYDFEHWGAETEETRKYLQMAIDHGHEEAKKYLVYLNQRKEEKTNKEEYYYRIYLDVEDGIRWITGENGSRDYVKAANLLIEGARKGLIRAIYWLSLIFIKSDSKLLIDFINQVNNQVNNSFTRDFYKTLSRYLNPYRFSLEEIEALEALEDGPGYNRRVYSAEERTRLLRDSTEKQLERFRQGAICSKMYVLFCGGDCDGEYYGIKGYFEMNCPSFEKGMVGAVDTVEEGAQIMLSNFAKFAAGVAYQNKLGGRDNNGEAWEYYDRSTIAEACLFKAYLTELKEINIFDMVPGFTGYPPMRIIDAAKIASSKGSGIAMFIYGKYLYERYSKSGDNSKLEEAERMLRKSVKNSDGNKVLIYEANKILSALNVPKEEYSTPLLTLYFDIEGRPSLEKPFDLTDAEAESKSVRLPQQHGFIYAYGKEKERMERHIQLVEEQERLEKERGEQEVKQREDPMKEKDMASASKSELERFENDSSTPDLDEELDVMSKTVKSGAGDAQPVRSKKGFFSKLFGK